MQIDVREIERMDVPELDELRHQLKLSKRKVCAAGDINPGTYTRWMRYFQGLPKGSCPQPRSLRALRAVLADEVSRRSQPEGRRSAA